MPLPEELRDAIAARRLAESAAADRERLRDLLWSSLHCLLWAGAGLFCIMWSAHTTDVTWGRMAFFGGLGVGNGGIIFTILAAYRRGEQRGDW